jgi:hypothetical protein
MKYALLFSELVTLFQKVCKPPNSVNVVFGHKAKRQWSFGNFEHEYVGCKESTISTSIKND